MFKFSQIIYKIRAKGFAVEAKDFKTTIFCKTKEAKWVPCDNLCDSSCYGIQAMRARVTKMLGKARRG